VSRFITDGNLVGYNATSSTISFNIQGTSGSNNTIFNVASSSGTSYLSIAGNGSTTISSLSAVGCVNATVTGSLYVASCASGGGASASGTPGMIQFYGSSTNLNSNQLFAWDNSNLKLSLGT